MTFLNLGHYRPYSRILAKAPLFQKTPIKNLMKAWVLDASDEWLNFSSIILMMKELFLPKVQHQGIGKVS